MATNNSFNNTILDGIGSIALQPDLAASTVTIGGTGLQTGTVGIATGTGAQTVNLATGGTGVKTVNIATGAVANVTIIGTTTSSSTLALKAPAGGLSMAGVAGNAVSNVNYVTINTSTGALGSAAGSNAGSWVLLSTKTASGSPTTISFTSLISSTYNSYVLTWSNVVASTPASLTMVISTNNGSSYASTGYLGGINSTAYNSSSFSNGSLTSAFYLSAGDQTSGNIWLYNVQNGAALNISGTGWNGKNSQMSLIGGSNTSTSVNALQVAFGSTGYTFTSGTFTLYGIVGS